MNDNRRDQVDTGLLQAAAVAVPMLLYTRDRILARLRRADGHSEDGACTPERVLVNAIVLAIVLTVGQLQHINP